MPQIRKGQSDFQQYSYYSAKNTTTYNCCINGFIDTNGVVSFPQSVCQPSISIASYKVIIVLFFNSCQDLKKLAREFERRRAQTGGGPPPEQPEYFEAVKDVLGEDYASSHGINGKISLAVCCTSHNCLQVVFFFSETVTDLFINF